MEGKGYLVIEDIHEQVQSSYGNALIRKVILMLGGMVHFSNLSVAQVYAMIEDMEAQSIIDDETMLIRRIFFGYGLHNANFMLLSTGLGRFQSEFHFV